MSRKSRQRSIGEMISSLCFYAVGLMLFIQGMDWQDVGNTVYAWLSWGCALLCLAGGMRFIIADAVSGWGRK